MRIAPHDSDCSILREVSNFWPAKVLPKQARDQFASVGIDSAHQELSFALGDNQPCVDKFLHVMRDRRALDLERPHHVGEQASMPNFEIGFLAAKDLVVDLHPVGVRKRAEDPRESLFLIPHSSTYITLSRRTELPPGPLRGEQSKIVMEPDLPFDPPGRESQSIILN